MAIETTDDALVELSRLTGMSIDEWSDFLSLPPEAQSVVVQNYRDADWAQSGDTLSAVIGVIVMLGTVAGAIAGVASAASAVKALQAL